MNLHRIRGDMLLGKRSGNCLAYALLCWVLNRDVELRFRRSPDFPLLPRVSHRYHAKGQWMRFQHVAMPRKDGWRRWLPVHALWFIGRVRRDFA